MKKRRYPSGAYPAAKRYSVAAPMGGGPARVVEVRRRRRTPYANLALGVENKFVDQILAPTVFTATWTSGELDPVGGVNCIGACVQGSGESQRDGTRIVVKSIQIQGYVSRTVAQDQPDCRTNSVIQLSLVMDRQSNGVQLSAEDVYGLTDPEVPGRRVVANQARFKVLKTWLFTLNDTASFNDGAATASIAGMSKTFSCYLKMNQVVNFVAGAGGGTIADFRDVSFHMIGCSNVALATETVTYNSRVRFIG